MTNPAIDKLTNFTAEERALAERLVRPQGQKPSPNFDAEQFLAFLAQVDAAREADKALTRAQLVAAGMLQAPDAPSETGLRLAV